MRTSILILAGAALLGVPACSRSKPDPAPAPTPARTRATSTRAVPATSAPTRSNAAAFAEEVINRTNTERRNARLAPFTRSTNLMRAAEIQAAQMARTNTLEHDIPGAAYPTLGARLAYVQYQMRGAGENIGEGYRTPAAAMAAWMGSAGHRANILSATYTEIGAAMAPGPNGTVFWVQVFGRPK